VVAMSCGQTEKQVQLIIDFAPDVIMATPSYMLNICEEFARQGVDPRSCSLKIGIFGAEPWTEAMRADIEARVDLDAVDLLGCQK
jgi:phenylacetate-CoA ligase